MATQQSRQRGLLLFHNIDTSLFSTTLIPREWKLCFLFLVTYDAQVSFTISLAQHVRDFIVVLLHHHTT